MLKLRKLTQRGDTIIEVLISLAVLSLILTTSFSLANRSVLATRQANERGEATKTAQSEIEELKYYFSAIDIDEPPTNELFCINQFSPTAPTIRNLDSQIKLAEIDDPAKYNVINNECREGVDERYAVMIQRTGTKTYTVYVRWDSLSGRTDKISVVHKLYPDLASQIVSGTVAPPLPVPVVNISATPNTRFIGQTSRITWSATNSPTPCVASGDWSGNRPMSSTPPGEASPVFAIARIYTFRLECTNGGGTGIGIATVTVTNAPPPAIAASINPASRSFSAWHLRNTGGTPLNQTFTITGNPSSGPMQLTSVGISGPNADNFRIIGNNCTNRLLTGAQSCVVTAQFYPPSGGGYNRLFYSGNKSATLTVNSVMGPINASLAGRSLSDQMLPGDVMTMGQYLRSYNPACYNNADACGHILVLQTDTNLVLYPNATWPHSWCTCAFTTNPVIAVMQGDGHLVVYDTVTGAPIWYGAMAMGWTYWAGDFLRLYDVSAALNQIHADEQAHYNFAPWGGIYH